MIIQNSQPPILTVIEPQDYFWTYANSVSVTGNVSDPNATLTVNNDTVVVAPDGIFSVIIDVTSEIGTIEIVATNSGGSDQIIKNNNKKKK